MPEVAVSVVRLEEESKEPLKKVSDATTLRDLPSQVLKDEIGKTCSLSVDEVVFPRQGLQLSR